MAGCGEDDGTKADTGSASTPAPAQAVRFTGKPVTIYTSAPLKTPIANVPESPAGLKAAAKAMNARGGLVGHKVLVKVCNDTDPNAEVTCARNAKRDGALALAGAIFLLNGPAANAALAKEGIPSVASILTPGQYSSPIVFPIDDPADGYTACPALAPAASGKSKIGMISQNLPIQLATVKAIRNETKLLKSDFTKTVVVPIATADFSSAVQELADKGSEIVISQLTPPAIPGFVTAANSLGKKFVYCSTASQGPVDVLKKLGPLASDYYFGSTFPPLSDADKYPLLKQFVDEMKAAQDAGDEAANTGTGIPSHGLRAWLGLQVIEQAAKTVKGELNSASLMTALQTLKVDFGGVVPPIDYSKPNAIKGYERLFNAEQRLIKWDPAKKELVSTDAEPIDALKVQGVR